MNLIHKHTNHIVKNQHDVVGEKKWKKLWENLLAKTLDIFP